MIVISGPPKSGKSELAERLFDYSSRKAYVATLPNIPELYNRIDIHKKRRIGKRWIDIEFNERLSIRDNLLKIRSVDEILLDGFNPLIMRLMSTHYQNNKNVLENVRDATVSAFYELVSLHKRYQHFVVVLSRFPDTDKSVIGPKLTYENFLYQYKRFFKDGSRIIKNNNIEILYCYNDIRFLRQAGIKPSL